MTESLAHLQAAAHKQKLIFGAIPLPIVPLFEEASSLAHAGDIMRLFLEDHELARAAKTTWGARLEMMVGYSDSASRCENRARLLPRVGLRWSWSI